MKCKNCGKEIEEGWKFCPNCNSEIEKQKISEIAEKEKLPKISDKSIAIFIILLIIQIVLIFIDYNYINSNKGEDIDHAFSHLTTYFVMIRYVSSIIILIVMLNFRNSKVKNIVFDILVIIQLIYCACVLPMLILIECMNIEIATCIACSG